MNFVVFDSFIQSLFATPTQNPVDVVIDTSKFHKTTAFALQVIEYGRQGLESHSTIMIWTIIGFSRMGRASKMLINA